MITRLRNCKTWSSYYDANKDGDGKDSGETQRNVAGSNYVASATVKLKQYKVNITKEASVAYAEVGDNVDFTITVSNPGAANEYGNIKNIQLKDLYNTDEFEFVSSSLGSDWTESNGVYTHEGEIASGGNSSAFTITLKVKKMSFNNEVITNTARIINVSSKYDVCYTDNNVDGDGDDSGEINRMASGSIFTASDSIILKIYSLEVSKEVNAVYDKNNNLLPFTSECEIGDTVEFKIDVTNTGSDVNLDGKIYEINISDYYDSKYLSYVSIEGTNWELASGETIGTNGLATTELKYTNSNGLGLGETATFYVKVYVNDDIALEDLLTDVTVTNTAEIKENARVINKNDIDIRSVLNGKLIDDASIIIRSYHVKIEKYITKVNGSSITGRENMTVEERNNNPVEVEQTDSVVYSLRIENSNGANLKNITVTDTLEAGIEFSDPTGSVVAAKKYTAAGTEDISVSETSATTGSKDITYSGTIQSGEYIIVEIKCTIVKTNMYLYNLKNDMYLESVYNRNDISIIDKINYDEKEPEDYVRLKNLIISGIVWIDKDEDGLIGDTEEKVSNIVVTLHDDTNNKVAETTTDGDGYYIFGATNGTNENGSEASSVMVEDGENLGRVIKATNRDDSTGNYSTSSEYINYYIEYTYNGVKYESTPTYAGKSNLNTDNTFDTKYMKDSNAKEFKDLREEFNESFETIAFNKGMTRPEQNETELKFEKNGHISTLDSEDGNLISSYSFVKGNEANYGTGLNNGSNIDMLFFGASGNTTDDVKTEYLKYINLGLKERNDLDLKITKDMMYANLYIKGKELDYEYGQVIKEDPNALYYRDGTEGIGEEEPYELYLYKSDFYYRHDLYENQAVRDYFGIWSELEIMFVYKITVTNESAKDTFVKIDEIIDYHSDTMSLEWATVQMVTIDPVTNEKVETRLRAEDYSTFNETSKYEFDGYNTVFITGMEEEVLKKGESFDIFLSYHVDKRDLTIEGEEFERVLYTDDKINVAQIGAYSTYEDEGCTKPRGLVDNDSNAGNINTNADGIGVEEIDKYDDNAFRIVTDIKFKDGTDPDPDPDPDPYPYPDPDPNPDPDPDPNPDPDPDPNPDPDPDPGPHTERYISGYVFEDARSILASENDEAGNASPAAGFNEFVGNGLYTEGTNKDERHALLNDFEGMTKLENQDLANDKKLEGMTVELIEVVRVDSNYDGIVDAIYEETIDYAKAEKIEGNFANVKIQTDSEGNYYLEAFAPGDYIVRFRYGDMYTETSITENSLIHNGQDYRSTVYAATDDADNALEEGAINQTKIDSLKEEGKSDARDNEYRRLQVMAESETMTNNVAEFMKFTNYEDGTITDAIALDNVRKFTDATECFADTVSVTFGIEDSQFMVIAANDNRFIEVGSIFDEVGAVYMDFTRKCDYIPFVNIDTLKFELPNVDYGVSYRPENFIELTKKIKSIKIETSAGNVLVDLEYEYDDNFNAKLVKTKGAENMQAIDTMNDIQGFRYINIDEELMQGAKVSIQYYIFATNIGEVETATTKLIADDKSVWGPSDVLKELNPTLLESTLVDGRTVINYSRMNEMVQAAYGFDYTYGSFVGAIYYKGRNISTAEANELRIVPVKVERLIDWVDNDATFEKSNNESSGKYWVAVTEEELIEKGLIDPREILEDPADPSSIAYYKDEKDRKYTSENKKNIALSVDTEQENPTLVTDIYPEYAGIDTLNSKASVVIEINSVLSSGTANEGETSYDNVSEIAQFETVVGRRTNFASTVGNIHLTDTAHSLTPFMAALYEVDTAGTEIVSLTPPTGLTRFKLFMAYNIRIMQIIAIVIVVIVLAIVAKKYLIGRKKFYK